MEGGLIIYIIIWLNAKKTKHPGTTSPIQETRAENGVLWLLVPGSWLMALSYWFMALGSCLLAIGSRLVALDLSQELRSRLVTLREWCPGVPSLHAMRRLKVNIVLFACTWFALQTWFIYFFRVLFISDGSTRCHRSCLCWGAPLV